MKRSVIVFGGGISALSTGIHLLEDGGAEKYDVTLLVMEHRLGGKAASWRLPDGRLMEIGFHAIFGYYRAIKGLLERTGHSTRDPRYFTSNEGRHLMYEAEARALNRLQVPKGPLDLAALVHGATSRYEGMSALEKARVGRWLLKSAPSFLLGTFPESLDEDSFTAWAVSTGLDVALTRKSWFRYVLDLAFNHPNEGSAYVGAVGFQALMGYANGEVHYLNGGLSEIIIAPLARRFRELGGKVEFCTKVTRVELDVETSRVTRFGTKAMARPVPIEGVDDHVGWEPIAGSYALEEAPYPAPGEPAAPEGEEREWRLGRDFDELVWTLPIDSTKALLRTAPRFREAVLERPELERIWHLRTVASLSYRIWLPNKVMPPDCDTVVMGAPQPAATIIDYTNRIDEFRRGRYGSIVEFEGQEGLYADHTDEELARVLLERFRELPFVDAPRVSIDDILHQKNGCRAELRRNTANHVRYVLMEPGHWKFRPRQTETGYENLVLAGDWMHGTQPTASMEAAVRTGIVAANHLRDRAGLGEVAS